MVWIANRPLLEHLVGKARAGGEEAFAVNAYHLTAAFAGLADQMVGPLT